MSKSLTLPRTPSAEADTMARSSPARVWREQRPLVKMDLCNLCGRCLFYCPEGALAGGREILVNLDFCKGCGICANECPARAIVMQPEYTKDPGLIGGDE